MKILIEILEEFNKILQDSKVVWSVDASDYLKGLQLKFATRFPKKIIGRKGKKNQRKSDEKFFFDFFFKYKKKKSVRGRKVRWGVFKGDRVGGFEVGRFKRGADLEHNLLFDLVPAHQK